jgi:hypothetical protein
MALDLPPLVRAPLAQLAPVADFRNARPLRVDSTEGAYSSDDSDASGSPFAGDGYRTSTDESPYSTPRQGLPSGGWAPRGPGALADSTSWDQSRPIYNPRGAPSDAAPALSRLQARISFEPLYMHQYASTLYACVSFMPWTLSERRARVDLMV